MKALTAFVIGAIALPLLVILAGLLGFLPSSATSSPPGIESSIAARALDASLEKRSKGLRNPITANDTAALAAGMRVYRAGCAGCRGDATAPSDWGSKGFYPRVPQFWQQKESDLTPEEAYAAIHDGIRYSGMGAWNGMLKDDDMWKVANFVARIHALPPALKSPAKPSR